MAVTPGTRLGPYEILSLIGTGGMGEVFRAHDTRLNRVVAIKVLSAELRDTPDRRQRFQREARAIAALSHQNICAIFDVGDDHGLDFLVLEHLEGETLARALTRGALPIEQLLRVAVQMAEALDAAHRAGIVHRDLKPANVFLTRSGAKLLDFGLAKLHRPSEEGPPSRGQLPPTRTAQLTHPGSVMGTPSYMAPEQVAGMDADARTDIFAFGAVLYEMATGRKAFDRGSPTATVAAILAEEPRSLLASHPALPPMLERVITACLAKAPDDRWQTARDLLRGLHWARDGDAMVMPPRAKRQRGLWLMAAAAMVGTVLLMGWQLVQNRRPIVDPAIHRLTVLPPEGATLVPGQVPLISPDGQRIVLNVGEASGQSALYVRALASSEAQIVPGTALAIWPFWSPDSQSIGFFADGKLKTIRLGDTTPRVITDAPLPRGGSWSRDGVILFTKFNNDRIFRIAAAGGEVTAVTTIDRSSEGAHWWPQFLPDGQHFLYYVSSSARPDVRGLYLAGLDGTRRRVVETTGTGVFAPPGFLLFPQSGSLVAQRFDVTRGEVVGTPVVVAEQVAPRFVSNAPFSISETGVLVLLTGAGDRQLAWRSRSGAEEMLGDPGLYVSAAVSGRGQVLVTRVDPVLQTEDLWLIDAQRGIPTRVTSHGANDNFPFWLSNAAEVIFSSNRNGRVALWRKIMTSGAAEEAVFEFERAVYPGSRSVDGRWQLFTGPSPNGDFDIGAVRLDGSGEPKWLLNTEFDERRPVLSPDGEWLAYSSAESGRVEVVVTRFPGPGERIPISNGGGYEPKWRADGRELFYVANDGQLMAVAVTPGAPPRFGTPQPLFQTRLDVVNLPFFWRYDVTGDGQRFLMIQPSRDRSSSAATVVLNWQVLMPR